MTITVPDFTINDPRFWHYRAQVVRVVDGDTIDVLIDKGFGDYRAERLRLLGINTPELHPRSGTPEEREAERARAQAAKARVEELVAGKEVVLRTSKPDKYGRWLATVFMAEPDSAIDKMGRLIEDLQPVSLNRLLVQEGHAVPYME